MYDWSCCGLSSMWGFLLVPWALVVCRQVKILYVFSNWATWQSGLILKMLFRIAVCCVKKAIKIASSSMFLKPPLGSVHVCVWALQKRSRILWGESLEQPCCLPASPLLLWQPLALPALGSHSVHSALSKHLPVCSGSESSQSLWMCTRCSLCNGSREVTWRIPFVCSKRTRNVHGWLKNNTQNWDFCI